jgi:glycerol-3-phosphate dehydrogenase subunit B
VLARAAGRVVEYRAKWFVLATGGVASGGVEIDSRWRPREKVLGLPLSGVTEPGETRFLPRYFDEHPFNAVGVAVDGGLRPVEPGGSRVAENVLVAGGTLAGARPWKEKSGDGISLATGFRAAEIILEEDQ